MAQAAKAGKHVWVVAVGHSYPRLFDFPEENCDYPLERCLHMDNLGRYCVSTGRGREVTLEEAKEILGRTY